MGAVQSYEMGISTEQSGAKATRRRSSRTTPTCCKTKRGVRHADSGCLHVRSLPEGSGAGASSCPHQEGDQGV